MKKTYSDLHPEIQRVVKERVEEQGNTYNPETAVNQDRFHEGFTWSKAKEGHDFWASVLDDDNEEVFFKKYSKSSFKVGDSVKCTNSNFLFNDCTIIFIDTSESLPCLLYSKKANRAEEGHDGDTTKHPDTGAKYGYWWVNFKDVQYNTSVNTQDFNEGDYVYYPDFDYPDTQIVYISSEKEYLLFSQLACDRKEGHSASCAPDKYRKGDFGNHWVDLETDIQKMSLMTDTSKPIKIGDLVEVVKTNGWPKITLGQRFVIENFLGHDSLKPSEKRLLEFNRGENTIHINHNEYCVNFTRDMLKIISSQHKLNSNDIQITTLSEQRHAGSTGSGVCHRRSSISTSSGCLSNQAINYSSKRCITSGNIRSSL